jgi:hypothetical protein
MSRGYIEHANLQCMPSFNAATLDNSMARVVTHSGRATAVSLSTYTIASIRSPSRSRDWKSSETTCQIAPKMGTVPIFHVFSIGKRQFAPPATPKL